METASEARRRGPGRPPKAREQAPHRITIRTAANRFDLDMDRIPDGMSYQWIAKTVYGKDNSEELIAMQQNGWTPVPAGRHPELTGKGADEQGEILRGGQILHERAKETTDYVKEMERDAADEQMETQLERVAAKSKSNQAGRVTKVKRRMVPIAIDGEDD